ncbi:M1 family metallopeptidase [Noviherbaspirillum galbum]|uniref:Aminopeptidase n=1 Tax=Noviherbaspirillum galbum TaxID=2709383 RepID=A0A6B3SLJ8_9BURK|nr:M1 family metallopeptidase [Noviherbaspirillum galbum]NEX61714.1 M1 family metallopeptidase [Noviherbaspirillum galbum]
MTRLLRRITAVAFATCLSALLFLPPHAGATLPAKPSLRLGDAVRPLAYELNLAMVPSADGFDGRITIDLELARAQDGFWMNATRLRVKRAVLDAGGKNLQAAIVPGGDDFIGLQFPESLPPGKARLTIEYSGSFSAVETRGLFKQQDGGEWYAFSQFEAMNARRAFPSFDEPQWKTPWTVSLDVRRDHVAVSNTAAVAEEAIGADMKRVRFATTAPLPTYLIAFGVGPFDVVDGGTAGQKRVPLRYIVPKGRGAEAAYAAKITPRLVELLEDYFGQPYPYPKLDSMAIPITVNFGAMENPGLITYRSSLLMSRPEREDESFRQRYASVGSHEIAHQWFGDLVTMSWWNDLWLNESFATWMARKNVRRFNPEWETHGRSEHERQQAMHADRLATARKIRQPIVAREDVDNAFDSITYDKGGAVLTMFETWLGEDGFRDGVRRYLKRHAFGNATAEDFFNALADTDPSLAKGFASFVEQPGVPHIAMRLDCTGKPALHMTQERFLPARKDGANAQSWTAPVCLRIDGQDAGKPFCTVLRSRSEKVALPVDHCPAWILPNPKGAGYYLSSVQGVKAIRLAQAPLKPEEAVSMLGDLSLLVNSGSFPADVLLDLVAPFAADPRPEVAREAAEVASDLYPTLSREEDRRRYAAWIRNHFGKRAVELGWLDRQGDSDAVRKLRMSLLPLVTEIGGDAMLRDQARQLSLGWLRGDGVPLGGMFRQVLRSAAFNGDAELFDALAQAVVKSKDSDARNEMYKALGSFRAPELRQRAFALVLSDQVDAREASTILYHAGETAENAPALQQFLAGSMDALMKRLPDEMMSRMPRWGQNLCTAGDRERYKQVFGPRIEQYPAGARSYAQALETIDICIGSRKAQETRLSRFLAGKRIEG